MIKMIAKIFTREDGATGIEYGLIASLIGMAVVGEVTTLGNEVGGFYEAMESGMNNANTNS